MAFACQRDSYAKELVTTVKSCTSAKIDGKLDGYEVILGDTVLFPEGGGQVRHEIVLTMALQSYEMFSVLL